MKSPSSLFWTATLLLTLTSSSAYNIRCSKYDSDFESQTVTCNAPSEYCGIDKTTGAIQGCVSASQCPANVADNRIIVCDASKPGCCCLDSGGGNPDCNDILHPNDDSQWKQACTISYLQSPSDICKVNPTRRVFCAFDGYYGRSEECRPFQFCGIDKTSGDVKDCLPPSKCPSSGAKGSKQIVCDGSATHCCCQDIVDRSGSRQPCNYILNEKDSTIWQQACSLKELKSLPVCQDDPTKEVFCEAIDSYFGSKTVRCKPSKFCGIDKTSGDVKDCLDAIQCPSSVSDKISCDPSKPFCCCQIVEDKDFGGSVSCNNILDGRDNTIWKQACGLPELKNLPVCQEDPTKAVYCEHQKSWGAWETGRCKTSEFCAIDKSNNGRLHKCLDSSFCPAGAQGSEKIVCDDTAPFCCCQKTVNAGNSGQACNNILDEDDSTIWQQACEQEQLKDLPVCRHDPSKKAVYCSYSDYNPFETVACKPFQFCGIERNNGKMTGCLNPEECPEDPASAHKIFCADNGQYCCCQKVDDKIDIIDVYGNEDKNQNPPSCNNILNWKDTSIWKQACALEQLKNLEVCKSPPTESTPSPPPVVPTDGDPEEYGKQEGGLEDWEIALIVISVLIILAILACVLFCCYKKRGKNAAGRGGAVQGQQQGPANEQQGGYPAAQMPPEGYYPVQQGYNLQAGQSAPLVPVNPAYQQPTVMSMPNVRYY